VGVALGLDPGHHHGGAAAVTDDGRVVWWGAWRTVGRRWEAVTPAGTSRHASLTGAVSAVLAGSPEPAAVLVEGTPRYARSVPAVVTQAEAAGVAVACATLRHGIDPERPLPATWRPAVLRCPGNDPGAARLALAWLGWATVYRRTPWPWPVTCELPQPEHAHTEHVAEAAALAAFFFVARRAGQE
jgi:Holliday junction resolvasome RuvABC endonuclease subunit